ncbi:bifunctional phosphoglucose/phosphomannose isomerase [Candidatus Woesearchaeota archaeon]|nr:bifunctional phosphoglucose/phosphomannose isomerase [Candidatus Woesearchaeota archaeon]MBT5272633.1 bifunctional phosphoglucose/phosphomannose isomerase [Candidatus Woesearchaeota archaeon]MBT6041730.1 bifunctional phosphoglucose/phosphomannose isomerase [Candidatus Woesearchaeota archaeon]MBT6337185.1 bifunctional phosphoglucose/phosphomannose isomerase [Candidatus Woesearchaeota archaeon]MBT7928177.1 bifunctional phosphoglucose/phosphomannose isomerase [Candidatus Woesearchaeota archaeon
MGSDKDIRQVVLDMPKHIVEAISIVKDFKVDSLVNSIVIAGMGGSAIAGDVLKTYLSDMKDLRIEVNRDYQLPSWVDEDTLVIVSSYSGNTEETISAYRDALKKKCKVVGMATGGKIKELFTKKNQPFITLPGGLQPRNAICYSFFAMLRMLENSNLIPKQTEFIKNTVLALKKPMLDNAAKDLAKSLVGKIPLIYASHNLAVVAYRWKCEFNENTKIHAFCNILPELNHNELVGYTKRLADFHVIFLKDQEDNKHIKKRIKITKSLVKHYNVPVTEIGISGPDKLTKLFSAIMMGDLTSVHLAKEYGVDAGPVEIIEKLKDMLKE